MDNYLRFKEAVKESVDFFESFNPNETVRIISHLDTDGICASSIIIKALLNKNMRYSVSIIPQLDEQGIIGYSRESYKNYIFTDLGSGQIGLIKRYLKEKRVLIMDHHVPKKTDSDDLDIVHLNPHLYGIDGSEEIAGAGVVYHFARRLSDKNKNSAHLAILGAIGDAQEKKGFGKLNDEILKDAVEIGKLNVENGIRFFGASSRPLHKLLEFSTDPFIPEVTGSTSGAIKFLKETGINPKLNNKWRMLSQLTGSEVKKLSKAIIEKRSNEKNPADITGPLYHLYNEKKDSPIRDLKEFSTLLNACGRMGKAGLGIGTCLGDISSKQKAILTLKDYKKQILNSMRWIQSNKNTAGVIEGDKYIIINARDNISSTIIGTVASILSRSKQYPKGTLILAIAQAMDFTSKTSLRVVGRPDERDLREIIKQITTAVGGESGGHMNAAGSIIKTDDEDKFVSNAKVILEKFCIEEMIN